VIAFGVGWVLAGATLRPINRIERTAYAIGAERDFDRRVDHVGPPDEVGRLATTFNTMLTELQTAYRQVEHALQAQRRFVADASHELRTPLTTIRGNVGLLQRQPPIEPEDRVAALGDMADETDRLIRLVNDLLMLARADAGRLWRNEPVLIKPLIEDLCRQAQLLEPERRIHCEDILDLAVVANRDALKQVLLILLDNALKFTPVDGEVRFTTAVDADRVFIALCDTGPGIAPAALPHIFERFYRGDSSRTGAGAGLGLSIAKTLMDAQHGTISVESAAGRGSVFNISLPQAPVQPEPEDEPVSSGVVGA
jgi:signal transduction histidine kinase